MISLSQLKGKVRAQKKVIGVLGGLTVSVFVTVLALNYLSTVIKDSKVEAERQILELHQKHAEAVNLLGKCKMDSQSCKEIDIRCAEAIGKLESLKNALQ